MSTILKAKKMENKKEKKRKIAETYFATLIRETDVDWFEKNFEDLVKKNEELAEEGNCSQVPKNEKLLRRFTI